MPHIELQSMKWAQEYLESIEMPAFKRIETSHREHRRSMVTLSGTLEKYK